MNPIQLQPYRKLTWPLFSQVESRSKEKEPVPALSLASTPQFRIVLKTVISITPEEDVEWLPPLTFPLEELAQFLGQELSQQSGWDVDPRLFGSGIAHHLGGPPPNDWDVLVYLPPQLEQQELVEKLMEKFVRGQSQLPWISVDRLEKGYGLKCVSAPQSFVYSLSSKVNILFKFYGSDFRSISAFDAFQMSFRTGDVYCLEGTRYVHDWSTIAEKLRQLKDRQWCPLDLYKASFPLSRLLNALGHGALIHSQEFDTAWDEVTSMPFHRFVRKFASHELHHFPGRRAKLIDFLNLLTLLPLDPAGQRCVAGAWVNAREQLGLGQEADMATLLYHHPQLTPLILDWIRGSLLFSYLVNGESSPVTCAWDMPFGDQVPRDFLGLRCETHERYMALSLPHCPANPTVISLAFFKALLSLPQSMQQVGADIQSLEPVLECLGLSKETIDRVIRHSMGTIVLFLQCWEGPRLRRLAETHYETTGGLSPRPLIRWVEHHLESSPFFVQWKARLDLAAAIQSLRLASGHPLRRFLEHLITVSRSPYSHFSLEDVQKFIEECTALEDPIALSQVYHLQGVLEIILFPRISGRLITEMEKQHAGSVRNVAKLLQSASRYLLFSFTKLNELMGKVFHTACELGVAHEEWCTDLFCLACSHGLMNGIHLKLPNIHSILEAYGHLAYADKEETLRLAHRHFERVVRLLLEEDKPKLKVVLPLLRTSLDPGRPELHGIGLKAWEFLFKVTPMRAGKLLSQPELQKHLIHALKNQEMTPPRMRFMIKLLDPILSRVQLDRELERILQEMRQDLCDQMRQLKHFDDALEFVLRFKDLAKMPSKISEAVQLEGGLLSRRKIIESLPEQKKSIIISHLTECIDLLSSRTSRRSLVFARRLFEYCLNSNLLTREEIDHFYLNLIASYSQCPAETGLRVLEGLVERTARHRIEAYGSVAAREMKPLCAALRLLMSQSPEFLPSVARILPLIKADRSSYLSIAVPFLLKNIASSEQLRVSVCLFHELLQEQMKGRDVGVHLPSLGIALARALPTKWTKVDEVPSFLQNLIKTVQEGQLLDRISLKQKQAFLEALPQLRHVQPKPEKRRNKQPNQNLKLLCEISRVCRSGRISADQCQWAAKQVLRDWNLIERTLSGKRRLRANEELLGILLSSGVYHHFVHTCVYLIKQSHCPSAILEPLFKSAIAFPVAAWDESGMLIFKELLNASYTQSVMTVRSTSTLLDLAEQLYTSQVPRFCEFANQILNIVLDLPGSNFSQGMEKLCQVAQKATLTCWQMEGWEAMMHYVNLSKKRFPAELYDAYARAIRDYLQREGLSLLSPLKGQLPQQIEMTKSVLPFLREFHPVLAREIVRKLIEEGVKSEPLLMSELLMTADSEKLYQSGSERELRYHLAVLVIQETIGLPNESLLKHLDFLCTVDAWSDERVRFAINVAIAIGVKLLITAMTEGDIHAPYDYSKLRDFLAERWHPLILRSAKGSLTMALAGADALFAHMLYLPVLLQSVHHYALKKEGKGKIGLSFASVQSISRDWKRLEYVLKNFYPFSGPSPRANLSEGEWMVLVQALSREITQMTARQYSRAIASNALNELGPLVLVSVKTKFVLNHLSETFALQGDIAKCDKLIRASLQERWDVLNAIQIHLVNRLFNPSSRTKMTLAVGNLQSAVVARLQELGQKNTSAEGAAL